MYILNWLKYDNQLQNLQFLKSLITLLNKLKSKIALKRQLMYIHNSIQNSLYAKECFKHHHFPWLFFFKIINSQLHLQILKHRNKLSRFSSSSWCLTAVEALWKAWECIMWRKIHWWYLLLFSVYYLFVFIKYLSITQILSRMLLISAQFFNVWCGGVCVCV